MGRISKIGGYMTDIYKDLEEEIALSGGIEKMMKSDLARMREYQRKGAALGDTICADMRNETYRRTKVMILLREDSCELEDDINEYLSDMGSDDTIGFRLIDVKFSAEPGGYRAMLIYSAIDKPEVHEKRTS